MFARMSYYVSVMTMTRYLIFGFHLKAVDRVQDSAQEVKLGGVCVCVFSCRLKEVYSRELACVLRQDRDMLSGLPVK